MRSQKEQEALYPAIPLVTGVLDESRATVNTDKVFSPFTNGVKSILLFAIGPVTKKTVTRQDVLSEENSTRNPAAESLTCQP